MTLRSRGRRFSFGSKMAGPKMGILGHFPAKFQGYNGFLLDVYIWGIVCLMQVQHDIIWSGQFKRKEGGMIKLGMPMNHHYSRRDALPSPSFSILGDCGKHEVILHQELIAPPFTKKNRMP